MLGQMLDRRGTSAAVAGPLCSSVDHLAQLPHVLDRHDHLHLERLAHAGVDDGDRARLTGRLVAAEEAGHLLQRTLGGRQADALRRPVRQFLQPFQRQHQVRAALGGGERVDLVDDHRLDVANVSRPTT